MQNVRKGIDWWNYLFAKEYVVEVFSSHIRKILVCWLS